MVELKSFLPFRDAGHALENANDVSEGASDPSAGEVPGLHRLSLHRSQV